MRDIRLSPLPLAILAALACLTSPASGRSAPAPGAPFVPAPSAAARIDSLLACYQALGLFNGTALVACAGRPPFERALHDLVLDPLGLEDTGDLAMRPRAVVQGSGR